MGIAPPIKKLYSIAEYLAIEEETQHKHEFVFGEIFDMVGTTGLHNLQTLHYYILVSQYEYVVEVYERVNDFKWFYTTYEGLEQEIALDKLEITINTSQIYKNIKLWGA